MRRTAATDRIGVDVVEEKSSPNRTARLCRGGRMDCPIAIVVERTNRKKNGYERKISLANWSQV